MEEKILVRLSKKRYNKYQKRYSVGKMFGYWKLLDDNAYFDENNPKGGDAHYFVECTICGKQVHRRSVILIKKLSRKCQKCSIKPEFNPRWKGYKGVCFTYFSTRGLTKLSRKLKKYFVDLYFLQNKKCALTGLPIDINNHTASLDRINNNMGYTRNNCQWLHKDVNIMKNVFPQDYLICICHYISNKNNHIQSYKPFISTFGGSKRSFFSMRTRRGTKL